MKFFPRGLTITCAAIGLATSYLQAVPITGVIYFDGTGTLDSEIPTATAFSQFSNVKVSVGTQLGSYAGTDAAAVAMTPFTFLPALSPDPIDPLWTFTVGATTYSFVLDGGMSATKPVIAGRQFLLLSGHGTAKITGFDDTPGVWSLSTQGNTGILSFSAFAAVPDAAATLLLLGSSMIALGLFGRFRKRVST